jgi:hypothetical protein
VTPTQIAELERQGAELGRASRLAQGLPPQVEDPTFYAEFARLVAGSEDRVAAPPMSAA